MAKGRVCQNTLRTVKEAWEKLRAHDDKENSKLLEYFFILLMDMKVFGGVNEYR